MSREARRSVTEELGICQVIDLMVVDLRVH